MSEKKQRRNTNQVERVEVQYDIDPVVHGVRFYSQIRDDNCYYWNLMEEVADYDSTNPLDAGRFSADWIPSDKTVRLGAFSSKTGWYYEEEQLSDVHIGLYDDISAGSNGIANIPAKMKLIIEPRMAGMYKQNGSGESLNSTGFDRQN